MLRFAVALSLVPFTVLADVVGEAVVIDGGTLQVVGQPLRLQGIAVPAPDSAEGWMAAAMMRHIVAGHVVRCRDTGERAEGHMLAVCHRDDGHDIGELLIRLGHARDCQRASDGRYAAAEQQAQDEGRNLSRDYPLPRRCTL
jgi:endonuclease YncB( thermonuclease family)